MNSFTWFGIFLSITILINSVNSQELCRPGEGYEIDFQYFVQTSGTCNMFVTSISECKHAATLFDITKDKNVADDNQHDKKFDPKGCYYEDGSVKFNSRMTHM